MERLTILKSTETQLDSSQIEFIDKIVNELTSENPKVPNIKEFVLALSDQEKYWLNHHEQQLWKEYLAFRCEFKQNKEIFNVSDGPLYLLIEPTSVCNLKCPMCFQADESFTNKSYMGMMDINLFKLAIDEAVLIGVKAVTLASRGEPTLHPKLIEMLSYLKGKFLDLKLNTNGTKMSETLARAMIENGVNELVFSIDSNEKEIYEKLRYGAKFEKVKDNVLLFKKIRDQYPVHETLTRISGVNVLEEQNWIKFKDFWKDYVDQVGWVPAQNRWDTYNNEKKPMRTPCSLLWERIYLWHDGKTNPCDVDYKSLLSPGVFPEKSLKELWKTGKYSQIRNLHLNDLRGDLNPCDRCGVH